MKSEIELVCPLDNLCLEERGKELACNDGHSFPIISGIPRFTNEIYSTAFGFQWSNFPKTQFDSYTNTQISKKRVFDACGPRVSRLLSESTVLEVGCGAGRFTEILLNEGAKVYSVDLSLAVEVNANNFPISDRHQVIQADVSSLPFRNETFEIVFCLGVIQHTPNPEETIEKLAKHLAPGGWLIIDHYGKSLSWFLRTAPLFRVFLKRQEPEKAFKKCRSLYKIAKPLYLVSGNRYYRKFLNILFPVVYFDNEISELPDVFKDEWSILDTFDSLTDWHKHRRSPAQIHKVLKDLGLKEIECFAGGNGVVARATKDLRWLVANGVHPPVS
jgi:SAM-dependent methyltransferase